MLDKEVTALIIADNSIGTAPIVSVMSEVDVCQAEVSEINLNMLVSILAASEATLMVDDKGLKTLRLPAAFVAGLNVADISRTALNAAADVEIAALIVAAKSISSAVFIAISLVLVWVLTVAESSLETSTCGDDKLLEQSAVDVSPRNACI